MAKPKVISIANQKRGVCKSTTVYNLGAGLAMSGEKVLALDVDPQGDLTKMLGQRKPHELPLTLANSMNDVVSGAIARDHPEIMHHQEGFDFVPGNGICVGKKRIRQIMQELEQLPYYSETGGGRWKAFHLFLAFCGEWV